MSEIVKINKELQQYIESNILPLYVKNEKGHGLEHIHYVMRRSLEFAKQIPNLNWNIIYTTVAYHDIAHHIDKDNHEKLSALIFYENISLKIFFTDEERIVIKEAIEDHRASSKKVPRSIYGKILSTADRSTSVDEFFKRTYSYTKKHFPDYNEEQIINRAYQHTQEKYGNNGYAKSYLEDIEYQNFKKDIEYLLKDKTTFKKRYLKVNHL